MLLTTNILDNSNCRKAIKLAVDKEIKIILVHDLLSDFPSPAKISSLDPEYRSLFDSIAVPLANTEYYKDHCWRKIADKLFDRVRVRVKYLFTLKKPETLDWFISHRQKTGQGIAHSMYHELEKIGEKSFLDVQSKFDLHDLQALVKISEFFIIVLTEGIFESEFCLKGIL